MDITAVNPSRKSSQSLSSLSQAFWSLRRFFSVRVSAADRQSAYLINVLICLRKVYVF